MKSNKAKSEKQNNQQKIIKEVDEEQLEEEDDDQNDNDDQVNEKLFTMYDQMFKNFNDFGAMFQQTASCIGILIKKNMTSNQRIEELEEQLEISKKEQEQCEEAYENMIQTLTDKERQIEDLMGENTSLKIQLEQFLLKKPSQQQQRDILKEREDAHNKQSIKHCQQHPNLLDKKEYKPSNKELQLIPGTFESFFDLDKQNDQKDQDSCSLKDLFSLKNTKKRPRIDNEEQKDNWMSNKRKMRRQEDSQIADRFEQLSQAFFNLSNKNINDSDKKQSPKDSYGGLLQNNNEDSVSSTSVINACIRFDAQSAKDNLIQSKLNFDSANKPKKQDKKFELQVVEQISDSLMEDFFTIKNEKKTDQRGSGNQKHSTSSSNQQKSNAKAKTKMF